jgi:hypothetical protein
MAALPEDPEKQILDQFQNPSIDDGSGLPDGEETQPPADDAAPGDAAPVGCARRRAGRWRLPAGRAKRSRSAHPVDGDTQAVSCPAAMICECVGSVRRI